MWPPVPTGHLLLCCNRVHHWKPTITKDQLSTIIAKFRAICLQSHIGVDTAEKFEKLTQKPYKKQAVWFLNAFWEEYFQDEAAREKIWEYCNLMVKLDLRVRMEMSWTNSKLINFLRKLKVPKQLPKCKELKEIDIDFNKYVALTEFFVFNYKCDVKALVNAPKLQTQSLKALTKAQQEVDLAKARQLRRQQMKHRRLLITLLSVQRRQRRLLTNCMLSKKLMMTSVQA